MRVGSQSSYKYFCAELEPFDVFWAVVAPFLALALRDPALLQLDSFPTEIGSPYLYAFVAIACSIPCFLIFRIGDGIRRYFSVQDVLAVFGAVATSVASSSIILFVFMRLDGIPRSTPLIYGLTLGVGLLLARVAGELFQRKLDDRREHLVEQDDLYPNTRHVLMIGVDRFSTMAVKLIDAQRPRTTQILGFLDARASFQGRKMFGVRVVGLPSDFENIVDEYVVHGVYLSEVWVADDVPNLSEEMLDRIREKCAARGLRFVRLSEALNLFAPPEPVLNAFPQIGTMPIMHVNEYFKYKRLFDIIAAGFLLVALAPLGLIAAGLTLFDVGVPIMFWQQRMGRNGKTFFLYKFRTYRAPFDKAGNRIPDKERMSNVGRAIRAARLDEIPQLLNVIVGDMSLIGPRPLLPHDQPANPRLRLMVRPGITGWAQINGGTIVTPEEKDALDVWYIQHANFTLDAKIILRTLLVAIMGESKNEVALEEAMRWRNKRGVFTPRSNNKEQPAKNSVHFAE